MTRRSTTVFASALAASAALAIIGSPAGARQARGACDISGQEQSMGASYVTSLKTHGTDCRTGKKVVKAYNRCRGAAGHGCNDKVKGYGCSTKVLEESPAQFDAKVRCTKGNRKVKFTFTQNV